MIHQIARAETARDRICLALDFHDEEKILQTVDELGDLVGYFKLNSAFTLHGPKLVEKILAKGARIFLDLKLHDIPNTLAGYGHALPRLGVHIVTVHVSGGLAMLGELVRSAEDTAKALKIQRPRFIGITLLTSISQRILNEEMNVQGPIQEEVLRKARMAAQAGLDGMVCSAGELAFIRPHLPVDFLYVTPGVRPAGDGHDDHQRVHTYEEAVAAGSRMLVVGRSVLATQDPRAALQHLQELIGASI